MKVIIFLVVVLAVVAALTTASPVRNLEDDHALETETSPSSRNVITKVRKERGLKEVGDQIKNSMKDVGKRIKNGVNKIREKVGDVVKSIGGK